MCFRVHTNIKSVPLLHFLPSYNSGYWVLFSWHTSTEYSNLLSLKRKVWNFPCFSLSASESSSVYVPEYKFCGKMDGTDLFIFLHFPYLQNLFIFPGQSAVGKAGTIMPPLGGYSSALQERNKSVLRLKFKSTEMCLFLEMGWHIGDAGNVQVEHWIFILHLCFKEVFTQCSVPKRTEHQLQW